MELPEFLTDPVFRSNIIDSLKEIQKQRNDIIKDSVEKHGLNKIDIKMQKDWIKITLAFHFEMLYICSVNHPLSMPLNKWNTKM